ncbi:MAG: radical SAM protein [Gemmatimonadota bacterium]
MRALRPVRVGEMRIAGKQRSGGSGGSGGSGTVGERSGLKRQLNLLPSFPSSPLPVLDERQRGTRFIAWPVKSVLNTPASTGMGYWSLNPYVGCEFGCTYCYARDTHRYALERATTSSPNPLSMNGEGELLTEELTGSSPSPFTERGTGGEVERGSGGEVAWTPDDFERRILVKTGAADVLVRTLDPARLDGSSLVIGTATDPYQPAERKFRLTRKLLEQLKQYQGLSIGIITKSPLVTRDLRLLQELTARHEVTVNISLCTADAILARRLERRSPIPQARLRAMETLLKGGVRAGLLIAPILPGINDDRPGLARLFQAASDAKAVYAHGSALRLDPVLGPRFIEYLAREFPEMAERYRRHFDGRWYVTREYQQALSKRLRGLQREYGFATGDMREYRQAEGRLPRAPSQQKSLFE